MKCAECSKDIALDKTRPQTSAEKEHSAPPLMDGAVWTIAVELSNGNSGKPFKHLESFCNEACKTAYASRRSVERGHPTTFKDL